MMSDPSEVRRFVAWLRAARWATCAALWALLTAGWLFPHLELLLRGIATFGLTAAIFFTGKIA